MATPGRASLVLLLRPLLIVAAALTLATAACSHDSYLKVTLKATDGAFSGVTQVVVNVRSANGASVWLTYIPGAPLTFDTTTTKTLSIAFTPSQSGIVSLDVGVRSSSGECLGNGNAMATIEKGNVSVVTVEVSHSGICPTQSTGDGGTTFTGCDPTMPEPTCPANQTCFVNCVSKRGMCIAAGTKGPGESCANNEDCMPGTQCFNYGGLPGCAAGTKVCLKFCGDDTQCSSGGGGGGGAGGGGAGGAGGAGGTAPSGGRGGGGSGGGSGARGGAGGAGGAGGGTGGSRDIAFAATCRNPVVCSATVTTSYKTCSLPCDPRGDAKLGCPPGLLCFLYKDLRGGQDSPDCGCMESTRAGTDGTPCTSSASCAPGHICNMMGSTQLCRRLCKMTSPADCPAPKTCNVLLNNSVFGVCVGG